MQREGSGGGAYSLMLLHTRCIIALILILLALCGTRSRAPLLKPPPCCRGVPAHQSHSVPPQGRYLVRKKKHHITA